MTRKRWRKLMMAEAATGIHDTANLLNDIRHAKMVRGHNGELYWSHTNNPVYFGSYAEHMARYMGYRGCRA